MPNVTPGGGGGSKKESNLDALVQGPRNDQAIDTYEQKQVKKQGQTYGQQQAASQAVPPPGATAPPAKQKQKPAPPSAGVSSGQRRMNDNRGLVPKAQRGQSGKPQPQREQAASADAVTTAKKNPAKAATAPANSVVGIITRVARELGVPPEVALAIGHVESGLNPNATGDGGTSFGIYQLHQGGELGTHSAQWAFNVENNARQALGVVAQVHAQHPEWDWGTVAAAAQRPADQAGYAATVNGVLNGYASSGQDPQTYFKSSGVASSGTSVYSGGAGGPSAAGPTFDQQALEKMYGAIAVALKDSSLQDLVQKAVNGGWDDAKFQQELEQTDFFKQHSNNQRSWLLYQANPSNRGDVKFRRDQTRLAVRQAAKALGVNLNPSEVQHISEQMLLNGWANDPSKIQEAVGAHFQMTQAHAQGSAGTLQDTFNQYAADYGIKVSNDTINRWIKNNLTGNMTPENVKTFFEQQASTMYPGLAKQIAQGHSVADIASTYRDSMASLLQLDPNSLDVFDPTIKKALQYQPDPTKPSELMPLWQFEQTVRQDPRWLNTDSAKQSAMDTGIGILKDWGLA